MSNRPEAGFLEEKLQECEAILEYHFQDRELFKRCLTHASVAKTRLDSNERLEFLGDSILGTVVCETLYHRFPSGSEGELTRMKSVLVSRETCARIIENLGLERFLLLGKGLSMHQKIPSSVMAAVLESLIAGVYLDGGMDAAKRLIIRLLEPEIDLVAVANHNRNFKSALQQLSQKTFSETPVYHLLDEKGPDHSKCFKVSAVIGSRMFAGAWGANKKEAEQKAADNAIHEIQGEEIPYVGD